MMSKLFVSALVLLLVLALPGFVLFAFDLAGRGASANQWLEDQFNLSHQIALSLPAATFLFCIPILIILLYFLRLKRTAIEVPSTFLWKKSIEDLHVNRLMQWMRKNVLLLLQLLVVLFLIYAALGPRTHGSVKGGRYYILMIDNSASMSAKDVSPTRLEWAKQEALREVDAATDSDSGMVIVFNNVAEIRQSYTTNREELRLAIRAIEPTQSLTRIDEALTLAASRANPLRSTANESVAPQNAEPGQERTYVQNEGLQAKIHLYSDGRFPAVPEFALANLDVAFHPPPTSEFNRSENVGIVRFFAERDPTSPNTVLARVGVKSFRGLREESLRIKLDVLDESGNLREGLAKSAQLVVPPEKPFAEGEVEFAITNVSESDELSLVAMLDHGGDAFSLDDQAWIVLGKQRKARVLVVTPGNRVLRTYFDTEAAKKLAEFVYLTPAEWDNPQDRYAIEAREGGFDLVIFDRCGPTRDTEMPQANTYFIGHVPPPYRMTAENPGDTLAVIGEKSPRVRGWLSRHPVMANLRGLDELGIADAFRLPSLPARTARLLEGDRDLVLLGAIPRQTYTDVVQTFPLVVAGADSPDQLWNSDWPRRLSFVMFLRNMLVVFGGVREFDGTDLKPGDIKPLRFRAAREAELRLPDNSRTKLIRGNRAEFLVSETRQLGLYTAEADGLRRRFAVNLLDSDESDLAPRSEITIGSQTIGADEPRKEPIELWKYFVLGGLVVLMIEWWIYNRRVQI